MEIIFTLYSKKNLHYTSKNFQIHFPFYRKLQYGKENSQ